MATNNKILAVSEVNGDILILSYITGSTVLRESVKGPAGELWNNEDPGFIVCQL